MTFPFIAVGQSSASQLASLPINDHVECACKNHNVEHAQDSRHSGNYWPTSSAPTRPSAGLRPSLAIVLLPPRDERAFTRLLGPSPCILRCHRRALGTGGRSAHPGLLQPTFQAAPPYQYCVPITCTRTIRQILPYKMNRISFEHQRVWCGRVRPQHWGCSHHQDCGTAYSTLLPIKCAEQGAGGRACGCSTLGGRTGISPAVISDLQRFRLARLLLPFTGESERRSAAAWALPSSRPIPPLPADQTPGPARPLTAWRPSCRAPAALSWPGRPAWAPGPPPSRASSACGSAPSGCVALTAGILVHPDAMRDRVERCGQWAPTWAGTCRVTSAGTPMPPAGARRRWPRRGGAQEGAAAGDPQVLRVHQPDPPPPHPHGHGEAAWRAGLLSGLRRASGWALQHAGCWV